MYADHYCLYRLDTPSLTIDYITATKYIGYDIVLFVKRGNYLTFRYEYNTDNGSEYKDGAFDILREEFVEKYTVKDSDIIVGEYGNYYFYTTFTLKGIISSEGWLALHRVNIVTGKTT